MNEAGPRNGDGRVTTGTGIDMREVHELSIVYVVDPDQLRVVDDLLMDVRRVFNEAGLRVSSMTDEIRAFHRTGDEVPHFQDKW